MGAPSKPAMSSRALLSGERVGIAVRATCADTAGECEPQAVWWAVEDLLLRLVHVCPATVNVREPCITFLGLRREVVGSAGELRAVALDPQRYRCEVDQRMLSFVRSIDLQDDDLLLHMTPPAAVERWPAGAELAQQVRSFVLRLAQFSGGSR